MAGRGRMPRQPFDDGRRGYPEEHFARGPPPLAPHPDAYEELEMLQHDIRRVLVDNRRLNDDRINFQRELVATRGEIHQMNMVIGEVHAEKDAHARDLIEKGLKLEADLRAAETLRADVLKLRAEVQKLNAMRQEHASKFQNLTQELTRAKSENQQISLMRSEIDDLKRELMRARTGFEYEKKGKAELLEKRLKMEKELVAMARELEKLRADLSNVDGRPWGAGGGYGMKLNSPDASSFPSSYADGYGLHSGVPEKAPFYGAGTGSWGTSEKFRFGRQ